jgi:RNA polymerase sigma-70 factor (ECF subfamily)
LSGPHPPPDEGFQKFFSDGYARLRAGLHAYLGDAADAEDVAAEAYLRAWQHWARISEYDDPIAWVRRVAWNLATSRHRRTALFRRVFMTQRPAYAQLNEALGPEHVALVAALRQLPERQRLAIVLHYLADLSVADIANELGAARGTVLSWLHRGRAQLAGLLGDEPAEAGTRTTERGERP